MRYSDIQKTIINADLNARIFLEGPYGVGKTETAVARMRTLAEKAAAQDQILVLTPQRSLAQPYRDSLSDPTFPAGITPTITTLTGLARRFVNLYWPSIQKKYPFKNPPSAPIYLNMESAQFYFDHICQPFFEKGYFLEVHIEKARLYSQILDTMNKAALVGYPLEATAKRLKQAWNGDEIRKKHYEQSQECAMAFRDFCFQKGYIDFSLLIEIFRNTQIHDPELTETFLAPYRHLIVDNLEEDVPILHDYFLRNEKLFSSMLLINDTNGGYRSFLGADPISAARLNEICNQNFTFEEPFQVNPIITSFKDALVSSIGREKNAKVLEQDDQAFTLISSDFIPDMVQDVSERINTLISDGVKYADIAVLSPFLPDSLKFSLTQCLHRRDIPYVTNRPSRTLAQEPVVKAVMTFAKLAHPGWQLSIKTDELRDALMVTIPNLDILRASLLAKNSLQEDVNLISFSEIPLFTRDRITYIFGEKYEYLWKWLQEYRESEAVPLDIFISLFFGEVISQPGFALHNDVDHAQVVNNLLYSVLNFRNLQAENSLDIDQEIGKRFIESLAIGILPASSFSAAIENEAVQISPAFTFLMKNSPVKYQFWLDIGNIGWWERLDQPLTHPYVLNRNWDQDKKWTDAVEYANNQKSLARLVNGLLACCEEHVFLYSVGLNQAGLSQNSPLLQGMQLYLKKRFREKTNA